MELWGKIKGYEGQYKVSNEGRVLSMLHKRERFLKGSLNNVGYLQVNLLSTRFLVHRLVAGAFLPNPANHSIVNHKDQNPLNNRVDNLEWCTQSHNLMCSDKVKGSKNYRASIDEAVVGRIMKLATTCEIGDIANYLGVSYSIVHKVLNGQAWNQVTGLPRVRFTKVFKQLKAAA